MRFAIFGSGAVGGYFGGRLAEAGEDVVFIARGDHLEAIRRDGLRVTSAAGNFVIHRAHVTDDPATAGPVDVVLVAVKAWQIAPAGASMRALVGPQTFVVPLENGIEAPAELSAALGAEHVLGGLCRIFASVAAPGHVVHAGIAPYIAFGELHGSASGRADELRRAFERTRGVRAEIPADIRSAMWSKFLLIAAWSGLGALTRAPIGIIRGQPETRGLLRQAVTEIDAVARGHGIGLPTESVERTLAFIDAAPPDGTASMQRDMLAGRPSELDAQVGAVVRMAQQVGVEVPLHRAIHAALLPLERRARGELDFTI